MTARRILPFVFVVLLAAIAGAGWWTAEWFARRPLPPSGGLYFFGRTLIDVPQFFQNDPRWSAAPLGPVITSSLGAEGCAVTSAAMILASYGIDTDPARLNQFLTGTPGGYTPEGWIYWEKAAEFDPSFTARLLPHYEDKPSYFLIDWNLLDGNPVIARIRYPSGITHFVVICGKEGFDYLIRDPGPGGEKGVYPLKDFQTDIEAIRFYKKP